MNIKRKIGTIADFASEIDMLEWDISLLTSMAHTLINFDFTAVDVIMETLPTNGARPAIQPLYPALSPTAFKLDDVTEAPPQPIGFQRWYNPADITANEGSLTVMIELDHVIALAIIDTALKRLKKRKSEIFRYSKQMLKP